MICNFLQKNHITPVFDMENFSPYAAKYYEWISFDDSQSLTYKAEFIKSHNFGGAMVYCLNADDFKGICNMGVKAATKFPLISSIKNALNGATWVGNLNVRFLEIRKISIYLLLLHYTFIKK